jgi:uncharacterized protein (TIGR03437 family)
VRSAGFAVFTFAALSMAAYAQPPSVASGGVLNAASFTRGQAVAAGSLVSIFGSNLASSLAAADTIPLSTTLGNVSVTFNSIPAPLLFVNHDAANGDQINAQMPWNVLPSGQSSGNVNVVVTRQGQASAPASVSIGAVSPGVFSVNFGSGNAIAYGNSDGIIAAAPGAIPGLTTKPAKINDPTTLVILATGLGPVDNPPTTGAAANDGQLHKCLTTPQVLVGNVAADVVFAGLTPQFVGVYQINIVIKPGTPTGDKVPIQIVQGGITTSNQVTIAVSN